jgi:hypothetical protein
MSFKSVALVLLAQLLSLSHSVTWSNLAVAQTVDSTSPAILARPLVDFPEVGIAVPQPDGFEKATSFHGFEQANSVSSVSLAKVPVPFSEIRKSISKERFAKEQLSLISQQPIKISNQDGFLLEVEQAVFTQRVQKWVVVFGDEKNTYWVNAAFLQEDAPKLREPLKQVVLATTLSTSKLSLSALPFTVKPVEGLKIAPGLSGLGKAVGFTRDGQIPQASVQDPLFIVAPSLGNVAVANSQKFADRRLYQYRGTKINAIKSRQQISIDDLSGWEIEATGQDQQTKTPLQLYQVMLFPQNGGYVLMTGIVGTQQASTYLPKFKAIARTYRKSLSNTK